MTNLVFKKETGMETAATLSAIVDAKVSDFLKKEGAEVDYRTVCDLVHASFPELLALETALRDDPDEAGRNRVVFYAVLPAAHPSELLKQQLSRFDESFIRKLEPSRQSLFALLPDFAEE